MKLPQCLLQFGTLALFSSMIGSLVLYRSGIFEANPLPLAGHFDIRQDSLQPPPFDSVQFKQVLREILAQKPEDNFRMLGSKSAPPVPPPPPKRIKGRRVSTDLPGGLSLEAATLTDTLIAMEVLNIRLAFSQFSDVEAAQFRRLYADLQVEKSMLGEFRFLYPEPALFRDSSVALMKLIYGPQHLPYLSAQEKIRFQVVLDSLTRPRMMSSKSGIIFISSIDSTLALKIVKSEKRSK